MTITKDPLRDGPFSQRTLFDEMTRAARGHPYEHVMGASLNVLINALRQNFGKRNQAEARFDELVGNTRQALLDHYDSTSGRRKEVSFGYDQIIRPSLVIDQDVAQGKPSRQ